MDGDLNSPGSEATDHGNFDDYLVTFDLSQFGGVDGDFSNNNPSFSVFDDIPNDVNAIPGGNSQGSNAEESMEAWLELEDFSPAPYSSNEIEGQNGYQYPMESKEGDVAVSPTLPPRCPQPPTSIQPEKLYGFIRNLPPRTNALINSVAADPAHPELPPSDSPPYSSATETVSDQHTGGSSSIYPRRIAPRSVSSRSDHSNTCTLCKEPVSSRMLPRHMKNRHRKADDPQYVCKCGVYRSARKDNYQRHLKGTRSCSARDDSSQGLYTCICQQTHNDKKAHQLHIENCGRQRAGRPRNNNRSVQ
ncbi:hypothetical protein CTA1_10370 [Colletotrichum tanaceti]|uniref:Uncharacterized protein n=1 Tax=Colletotrichum tanaceti TaxID=1306861 RepID=A0A4U6XUT0_9PEZI|nr:hypothetical protein CTA1_10370 [Colletotrichum tanaceti]